MQAGEPPSETDTKMTTVGIIGGLGPESTVDYYRRILAAWEREDPSTAPSLVIDSLDVQRALRLVDTDRSALIEYLLASLRRLAHAGADFAAMTANTPHIVFDELAVSSPIPLMSIVEVCAEEARRRGFVRLGLLGTRFTMEGPFYPAVFARYGIAVVSPNDADRAWVHERYVGQLLKGEFRDDTRREFTSLVGRLRDTVAIDGIILGGTELPLLLSSPVIADVPVLDTTALHVAAIVERLRGADVSPSAAREPATSASMRRARTLRIAIAAPATGVYAYVADPRHLPEWAQGLGTAPVPEGADVWRFDTAGGPVRVQFAPANPFGIADHVVTPLADGVPVDVPLRIIPNGVGSEVLFTLFQQPGMSDARFAADADLVQADLARLKERCERGLARTT